MRNAIETLLKRNSLLYTQFSEVYSSNEDYLDYVERLLSSLLRAKCLGLDEKIFEINDLTKFDSFQSELEIAGLLVGKGKRVEFLSDSYMGPNTPSPDLRVVNRLQCYIEVTKLTIERSSIIILEELRNFLSDKKFIVNVKLLDDLSTPVIKRQERLEKENLAYQSLEKFKELFEETDLGKLPVEIETEGAIFEVYGKTKRDKGYPGIISHEVITFPDEIYMEKIREAVREKAAKRVNWKPEHRAIHYVVALDCRDHVGIDDHVLNQALYGPTKYYMPPLKPPPFIPSEEIEYAKKKGWSNFMIKRGLLPTDQTCPEQGEEGCFLKDRIAKNVSAVLILAISGPYLFPNPFSFDEINDLNIVNWIDEN